MARDRANIFTNIWTDADWKALSRDEQHLYFLLLTHPELSYAGVCDWRTGRLAKMSGATSRADVEKTGAGLQAKRFIFIDQETEEVLVRSFIKHDGVLKHPKLAISFVNAYGAVSSPEIQKVLVHELSKIHAQFPGWKAFEFEKVTALLKQPAADMDELTVSPTPEPTLADSQPQPLGQPLAQPLGFELAQPLPTATATATATSSNEEVKPSSTADAEDGFDEWYSFYPRKEGKGAARKAFKAALKKTSLENLKAGLSAYCREVQGKERRHIAMPASWLNAERWDDEYAHNLTGVQDSEIDPDAILGKDYWMVPDPPEGLSMQEEIEWKKQQRANRRALRIEEAKRRLSHAAAS